MNWDTLEAHWDMVKGSLKSRWGKLTDDDLRIVAGKRAALTGKLQERYGFLEDVASKQANEWLRNVSPDAGREIVMDSIMKKNWTWAALPIAFCVACGASFPAPTQRMADAESAHRSALELGAASQPAAQLHVKLAEEQMTKAKALMSDGDNKGADSLLIRSKADSELALALAREHGSSVEAQKAAEQSNATSVTNTSQGAVK